MSIETWDDISNAFAMRKLAKHHAKELIPATEIFYLVIAIIPINTF